jgi:hypothetical protein
MKAKLIFQIILLLTFMLTSCESDKERQKRIAKEEQQKIELEENRIAKEAERTFYIKQERISREVRLEKERREKAIYDKYINNSLSTGSAPYSRYYGSNSSCDDYGCSQIKVRTSNSDVIVTIKKNGRVVRHAYINSGSSYTFSMPNGSYQPFFYYGKGWNPEKEMKGGKMKGGYITNESFGKDDAQFLNNNVLTYELILQENGNFSTRPSNSEEAF